MKKKFLAGLATGLVLLGMAGVANAAIIGNNTPIPDANVLINFNQSGLDWVYAGPIATAEWGAGWIEAPSYRSGEGWRFATAAEWLGKPDWTNFIQPGYTVADVPAQSSWRDHGKYKFASEYWSDFSHVDLNDAANGQITNGFDIGSLNSVWETYYVRDTGTPTPEPATLLLLGSGLAGLIGARRKKKA